MENTTSTMQVTEMGEGYYEEWPNTSNSNIGLNVTQIENVTTVSSHADADFYGSPSLYRWKAWYANYHGYVSVFVCVCGIVMNAFNIVVLTQRKMRSVTNMLLTGLAVSDGLTMMSYIPFALQFYLIHGLYPTPERNSLPWIYFFMFHVNFTVTVHTISIWLCVLLAVFRYVIVRTSGVKSIINPSITLIAIVLVYIFSIIILIPNYMSLTIISGVHLETNKTMYDIAAISTMTKRGQIITPLNFWIHAVMIKIIPCLLMSVFGALLIWTMHVAKKKQDKLRGGSSASKQSPGGGSVNGGAAGGKNRRKNRNHTRTTRMLVVVILLFLLTELPQGILALLSGTKEGFFVAYYVPLGDLMDSLALINNAINFVLYCSMSKQFRDTFLALFCCCVNSAESSTSSSKMQDEISVYTTFRRILNKRTYTAVTTSTKT